MRLGDLPGGPPAGTPLADLATLGEGAVITIGWGAGPERIDVLVLRWHGGVVAYLNRCPHQGTRLDFEPGRVLDPGGTHLQCATHGALFRPEDGFCVDGPCKRRWLVPVAVRREGTRLLAE